MDNDNLTDQEIQDLSLDLKVCFFLVSWNKSFNPKNVDDWINSFYIHFPCLDRAGEFDEKKSKDLAREEFNRLYQFVIKYILF